jgi:hypothetical protein
MGWAAVWRGGRRGAARGRLRCYSWRGRRVSDARRLASVSGVSTCMCATMQIYKVSTCMYAHL